MKKGLPPHPLGLNKAGHSAMRTKLLIVAVVLSVGVGILASGALHTGAYAQTAATADTVHPSFEVSSIKPNHSASGSSHLDMSMSRLVATNVTVKSLILMAYRIRPSQLSAAPGCATRPVSTSTPKWTTHLSIK